jgi:protein-disulfide isomerase
VPSNHQADDLGRHLSPRRWPKSAQLIALVILICIALVGGVVFGHATTGTVPAQSVVAEQNGPQADARAILAPLARIEQNGLVLGKPNAPVTLEEFADLQCPACQQFASTLLPRLIAADVATGKLRIIWRNLVFIGPDSVTAGRMASAAARQNKLWQFVELFFANAGQENTSYVTTQFLTNVATAIPGLNVRAALSFRAQPAAMSPIDEAAGLARQWGVTDTPAFLIGRTGSRMKTLPDYSIADPNAYLAAIADVAAGRQPPPASVATAAPSGCSAAGNTCTAGS